MAYLDFSNKRYSKDQLSDLRAMMVKLNSSTLVPEEAGSVTLDEFKEWLEETVQDYVDDNQEDLRGPAGAAGPTGPMGKSVASITNYYAVTATNTVPSQSDITSSTIPAMSSYNKYLWRKEVTTFSDNSTAVATVLSCIYGDTGETGAKGDRGDNGTQGVPGTSAYVHIKYAVDLDSETGYPSDADITLDPTVAVYLGVCSSSNSTASNDWTEYSWTKITGEAAIEGNRITLLETALQTHTADTSVHVTSADRVEWNNKASIASVSQYVGVDISLPRNLFDGQFLNGYWSSADGVFTQTSSLIASVNPISVGPDTDYCITGTTGGVSVRFYKADGTYINLGDLTIYDGHIQTPSEASVLRFHISPQDTSQIGVFEGTSGEYVPYVPTLREASIVSYGGSDSTGYYVRYSNGVQMCWRIRNLGTVATTSSWGQGYISTEVGGGNFPMPFIGVPCVTEYASSDNEASCFTISRTPPSSTKWGGVQLGRFAVGTFVCILNLFAIGRWK